MGQRMSSTPPMPARAAVATLLLATLGACGGAETAAPATTEPAKAVSVALTVTSLSAPVVDGSVSCVVGISAAVTGTGLGTWAGATYRMLDAANRSRVIASGEVTGAVLLDGFGTGSVIGGRSQNSQWRFTGPIAFAAEVEMQYEPAIGAPLKSATARFDCVPSFSLGAAAPTIGQLVVTPSQGALDAGTPLLVKYSASLPAGAVRTAVRVTGPCVVDRTFDERADTTVSRTLSIPLRYPCRLGASIGVNLVVFDVLGRGVAQYEATPVTMLDTVPPQAFLQLLHVIPGRTSVDPYSEYALGDTLMAHMGMSDNYRVSAILWELLPVGLKDSIVSPEPTPTGEGPNDGTNDGAQVWIGIRPEWAGKSLQLRLQARDATGRLSEVITTPQDSIRVAASPPGS
jgi:hypothetical protein